MVVIVEILHTKFLQLNEPTVHAIRALLNISLHFCNNNAQTAGSAVYGGSIDSCAIDSGYNTTYTTMQGITTFNWHVPNLELEPNSVSSDPFQVGTTTHVKQRCCDNMSLCISFTIFFRHLPSNFMVVKSFI